MREGEELLSAPKAVLVTPPSPGSLLILQVYFYFNVIWRRVAFYFHFVLGSAVVTLHCVPCVCRVPKTISVEVTFSMFIFFSVEI